RVACATDRGHRSPPRRPSGLTVEPVSRRALLRPRREAAAPAARAATRLGWPHDGLVRHADQTVRGRPLMKRASFLLPTLLLLFADRKSTRLNSSHVKISYAVF